MDKDWEFSKEASARDGIRADYTAAVKDIMIMLSRAIPPLARLEMFYDKKTVNEVEGLLEAARVKLKQVVNNLE